MQREPDITKQLDDDFNRRILTEIHKARAEGYELGATRTAIGALCVIILLMFAFMCLSMWREK